MKNAMRRLVGALLVFMWAVSACTRGRATPSLPANLVAEGWQDVQIRTLCLDVRQSYLEIDPDFSLPLEPSLRRVLSGLGLRVVASGETCDGALRLSLQGEALAEDYVCILGNACGHCFTGARISGELTLTSSDRTPWVHTFNTGIEPPSSISDCPKVPEDAPLDVLWPGTVLAGLLDLWGTPVLKVALDDRDEGMREALVGLLRAQGKEGVPLLVKALQDRSAQVRLRAANALGSLGAQAREAVPALVETLDDTDRPVRLATAGALNLITGHDLGQDQATWRKWLEEPSITPTPISSWKGVPIMPGSKSPEELGSQLMYTSPTSCGEVAAFYQTEMPTAGWAFVEVTNPSSYRQRLKFKKGRDTAEINLDDSLGIMGETQCSIQIFLLR